MGLIENGKIKKYYSSVVSLDWDKISLRSAEKRILKIMNLFHEIYKIELFQSAYNGWHLLVYFEGRVDALKWRDLLKDDGCRVVMDILRNAPIHEVLWNVKVIDGVRWVKPNKPVYVYVRMWGDKIDRY